MRVFLPKVNDHYKQVQYLHAIITTQATMPHSSFFADKPTKPDNMLPDQNIAIVGKNFTIKCVADGLPKPCKL